MKKLALIVLFLCFVFLRFWDMEGRMQFTWDQVQNAWVMKDMIVDHKLPLEGMVAKLNSGIHIGPAYYYLLVPFYLAIDLDPIAGGVFAGAVAIATFIALFAVLRNIFSYETALAGLTLYTFSSHAITHDRIAWPVVFLPLVSVLTFYCLVRLMEGNARYLVRLALVLGFSLHVHFTAVFLFIYVFLCLPFMIRTKNFGKYALISLPVFLLWTIPMILAQAKNGVSAAGNLLSYIEANSHGLHLVRVLQLAGEGLIEFTSVLEIPWAWFLTHLSLPLFFLVYRHKHKRKDSLRFGYLTGIWFAVPLVVFSLYTGEITNYYFAVTRPVVIMIYAYLVVELLRVKHAITTFLVILFGAYFIYTNILRYLATSRTTFHQNREDVLLTIKQGGRVGFGEGDPKSYLYYIYAQR